MKRVATIFGIALALAAAAAEPMGLESFKFELSCERHGGDEATIMVHANLDYDGKTNTCTVGKGAYYKGPETHELVFKCDKPTPVSMDKAHPIQTWVLTAANTPQDRISKLVLLFDHANKLANGFATSEDGIIHNVTCKKW